MAETYCPPIIRKRKFQKPESEIDRKESKRPAAPVIDLSGEKISAGIIMYHKNRVFLVQPTGMSSFGIPKGFVEQGETFNQAAIREFQEETGYYDIFILNSIKAMFS